MAALLITTFVILILIFGSLEKLLVKNYKGNVAHRLICTFASLTMVFMRPFWSYSVTGRENLQKVSYPCIIVANHQSVTDILLFFSLGLPFRAIGKESTFKLPFIGPCVRLAKYIPIRRGDKDSARESMIRASEVLSQGTCMFLYPEGTRSLDGTLLPFKMGAFVLAERFNVPLVPIIMNGAGAMLRKGSFIPEFFHADMKILPHEYKRENESVEDFANRIREIFLREIKY